MWDRMGWSWVFPFLCQLYPGNTLAASPVIQPAMQEKQEARVRFLGWKDTWRRAWLTHSSAWRISWTEEPGGLQCVGLQMVGHHWSDSAGKESACDAGHSGSILGLGRSPGEGIGYLLQYSWDSLVTQTVNNAPAMRETWVQSLGWEASLEEGVATHSSILAWRIPMDRGAWRATVHGVTKSRTRLSD